MRRTRNTHKDAIDRIHKERQKNLANRRRAILRGESQKQFLPAWDSLYTEFEVQAYLYAEFKARGFLVRGELKTKCGKCKFDLVLYSEREPVRIIEVKNGRTLNGKYNPVKSPAKTESEQIDKYAEFGVPVDLIRGMEEAIAFVREYDARGGFRQPIQEAADHS
jgi:hypothetical protein